MTKGKQKALIKLKTARGQIDGIINMIEDDRYCVDIFTQISSIMGLLKKANLDILDGHIRSCVTNAILDSEAAADDKIKELVYVVDKFIK